MLSIKMIRRVLYLGCLMSVVVCALSIYTIRKVSTHLLYNEHIYSLPRAPLANFVMSVRQGMYAVVFYVPFVVKSTQTQFRDLNSIHDVIRRFERTKSVPGCTAHVPQDPEEVLVPNALSHVMFLDSLCFHETL